MRVYQSQSGLLMCVAKERDPNVKVIADIGEAQTHFPKGIPGLNRFVPTLYFRGDAESKDVPLWEGHLYVEGNFKGKAEKLNPPPEKYLPLLFECREIFSSKGFEYLLNRHCKYPYISEWELQGIGCWAIDNPIENKLGIEVIRNILGTPEKENKYAQYVKLLGTNKGALLLFSMKETEIWPLLMGGYLSAYLERNKPGSYYLLAEARRDIESGFPIKEAALLLNSKLRAITEAK